MAKKDNSTEDEIESKAEETQDELKRLARKIWLAGIGAYGKAFTEGREILKTASERGSEVFEDLVRKGEELEGDVDSKAREVMDDVRAQVSEATKDLNLDDRIARMRARIKREGRSAARDMETRMDDLEAKLAELLDALDGGEKKPEPTRAKAKTTTQRTTRKAPVKKAPAKTSSSAKTAKTATGASRKPAPKKSAGKKPAGEKD